ncbi:UNVERIFIED_CONTAM: hypothetical protein FKN15_017974 [Acipenser sinensis]
MATLPPSGQVAASQGIPSQRSQSFTQTLTHLAEEVFTNAPRERSGSTPSLTSSTLVAMTLFKQRASLQSILDPLPCMGKTRGPLEVLLDTTLEDMGIPLDADKADPQVPRGPEQVPPDLPCGELNSPNNSTYYEYKDDAFLDEAASKEERERKERSEREDREEERDGYGKERYKRWEREEREQQEGGEERKESGEGEGWGSEQEGGGRVERFLLLSDVTTQPACHRESSEEEMEEEEQEEEEEGGNIDGQKMEQEKASGKRKLEKGEEVKSGMKVGEKGEKRKKGGQYASWAGDPGFSWLRLLGSE